MAERLILSVDNALSSITIGSEAIPIVNKAILSFASTMVKEICMGKIAISKANAIVKLHSMSHPDV